MILTPHRHRNKPKADGDRRNVKLDGLAPCHGWRRAAFRRGDREEVARARTARLNAETWPRRAKRWALAMLSAGIKPKKVQELTGIEIVTQKEGTDDATVR